MYLIPVQPLGTLFVSAVLVGTIVIGYIRRRKARKRDFVGTLFVSAVGTF